MAAHQAPLSLAFSRQEHWSGLPFPSAVHDSEKWKWSCSVVSDSQRPHGLQPTMLLHPWDFPGKSSGVGCHWLLRIICTSMYIISATSFFSLTYFCSIYFIYFFFLWKVTVSDIKINLFIFTKCLIGTTKLVPLTLAYTDTTGDWNAMRNWHPWGRLYLCF